MAYLLKDVLLYKINKLGRKFWPSYFYQDVSIDGERGKVARWISDYEYKIIWTKILE